MLRITSISNRLFSSPLPTYSQNFMKIHPSLLKGDPADKQRQTNKRGRN